MRELHVTTHNRLFRHFLNNDAPAHAQLLMRLIREAQTDVTGMIRAHPLGDEWMDFALGSVAERLTRTSGYIYLASTHDHEGLVKLGKTGNSPHARMAGLSRENVLHDFVLLHAVRVHDRHWVETRTHRALSANGVPRIKEFFPEHGADYIACIAGVTEADRRLFESQGLGSCFTNLLTV